MKRGKEGVAPWIEQAGRLARVQALNFAEGRQAYVRPVGEVSIEDLLANAGSDEELVAFFADATDQDAASLGDRFASARKTVHSFGKEGL